MGEQTLDQKIEALAQEMAARYGMPIERARALLKKAILEMPPTPDEIAEALRAATH